VPPVEDSVSWHEAIPTKRSLCQENAVLLVVQRLCDTASGGLRVGVARGKTNKGPFDDVIILSQP